MIIAGIDPGLANLGYAFYNVTERKFERTGVISTMKLDKRLERYSRDSNARRYRELWDGLTLLWPNEWTPDAFIEGMSQPRDASAAWKLALGWGAVLGVCESKRARVYQIMPMDIKYAITSNRKASKQEVIEAVKHYYPDVVWPRRKVLHEHMADAIATIHAALEGRMGRLGDL
jgi:Holliday junction resolvasome RuvABC endonuclease subunit